MVNERAASNYDQAVEEFACPLCRKSFAEHDWLEGGAIWLRAMPSPSPLFRDRNPSGSLFVQKQAERKRPT
jgi:hypothetical protein